MKDMPKISIVTPSYNQAQFLEETILSVLNQNYPNLEYIIIDGGSTDGSVDIIKKYADRLAYWVSEPDSGQSEAINKGFQRASGEILAWINSDDYYYPGVLQRIAEFFKQHPDVDFIFGYENQIDSQGRIIRRGAYFPFISHAFIRGFSQIAQPTSFWRKSVWEKCGPLDLDLTFNMDFDFFLKVYKEKFRIEAIPLLVSAFRLHQTSKTVANSKETYLVYKQLVIKHNSKLHSKINRYVAVIEVVFYRLLRKLKRLMISEIPMRLKTYIN